MKTNLDVGKKVNASRQKNNPDRKAILVRLNMVFIDDLVAN